VKKKIDDVKAGISEILELPKDIMLDLPKITLIGNLQVYIENHKGIIEYNKQRIRVNTKNGILRVIGNDMYIRNIITEEIIIIGNIEKIELSD